MDRGTLCLLLFYLYFGVSKGRLGHPGRISAAASQRNHDVLSASLLWTISQMNEQKGTLGKGFPWEKLVKLSVAVLPSLCRAAAQGGGVQ